MVPVTVDLAAEHGIGLVGASERTRPLARWLVIDAAGRRGPADLEVVVLTGPERVPSWEWVKWLPHARVAGRPAVWSSTEDVAAWASAARLGDRPGGGRRAATLVVVDEPAWWRAPTAVLRPLLADVADGSATRELWFVLVARSVEEVPGVCRVVVRTGGDDGTGRVVTVEWPERVASGVVPIAVTADLATTVARRLARFDDPDRPVRPHVAAVDGPLVVQPFIVGRKLTPMERRLAQLVERSGGGRGERPRTSEAVPP
jgi:S-DNA-T family DNA segregation ATPase FtsK/SpoIIIE